MLRNLRLVATASACIIWMYSITLFIPHMLNHWIYYTGHREAHIGLFAFALASLFCFAAAGLITRKEVGLSSFYLLTAIAGLLVLPFITAIREA